MNDELQAKYLGLKSRLETLVQEKIARTAQREERERHRMALVQRLTAAGVDVNELEGEKAKLEASIQEQLEAFERQIATAEQEFQTTKKPGG